MGSLMSKDEFDGIIGFLEGLSLKKLDGNERDAFWTVLQSENPKRVMKRAKEYGSDERARFGFPKPFDLIPERVITKKVCVKCPYCPETFLYGDTFTRDPSGTLTTWWWDVQARRIVLPLYQDHITSCEGRPQMTVEALITVKRKLSTARFIPNRVAQGMLAWVDMELATRPALPFGDELEF